MGAEKAKNTRKPLSQKVRFEVFKRDHFTCQYCGRMAPDVILEVDHIVPISKGGKNDITNLITSCRECNRGKGPRRLNDDSEIKKQASELAELAERKEQIEMMVKWRDELLDAKELQIDSICKYIDSQSRRFSVSETGRRNLAKLVSRFGFSEVYTSAEISFSKYFNDNKNSWEYAFDKIGGVCYNRSIGRYEKDSEK